MNCPKCGLVNPENQVQCDCGYDFRSKGLSESYESKKHRSDRELTYTEILFSFEGRIGRKTYWLSSLCLLPLSFPLSLMYWRRQNLPQQDLPVPILIILFPLIVWIGLALAVKRWHDRGKPGSWVFIGLIPIFGPLWAFIELGFLKGTPGLNEYDLFGRTPSPQPVPRAAVTFHCWQCKAEITAPSTMRGSQVKCNSCGRTQPCPR
jgi:uncharacterized membrane protein YhaH (DUF805 family)